MGHQNKLNRRHFLKTSPLAAMPMMGFAGLVAATTPPANAPEYPNVIGPREGFDPFTGSLLSMMEWMRGVVLHSVRGMTVAQLDYIHDKKANSIGGMLLHLAATEKFYQLHTFSGIEWGGWDEKTSAEWAVPMALGDRARKEIKGRPLEYYLDKLQSVREETVREFKDRGDKWLLSIDQDWPWGPTNNFCKWFHVCEHESNHNGQIKWISSRIPG